MVRTSLFCLPQEIEWNLDELMTYDSVIAAKLGLTLQSLDSAYSAFGQSEVSIIYTHLN
jgi:hypothetical protein